MRAAFLSIAVLLLACGESTLTPAGSGGSGGEGAAQGSGELPCAISEILESRCQSCHGASPKFGAPMPLVTVADLLSQPVDGTGTIAERAIVRMKGEMGSVMPPPPNAPATAAEIAALESWIASGHPTRPAGEDCGSGGGGGGGGGPILDCEPDLAVTAPQPFEMPQNAVDEQVCFGIDVPAFDAKRHITAIAPRIDNSKIIHHILLLQADKAVAPGPTDCAFASADWKLLYAWGPGTPPHVLPEEAGFPIEAGETVHLVLQVHYNNLNGLSGETDQSGVDLCTTTDVRPHDADIMALGGIFNESIPPMSTAELNCSMPIPFELAPFMPIKVFSAWPHMHLSGKELEGWIENASGVTPIVNVPNYDFEYQVSYPVDLELAVGDTVRTRCLWQNNSAQAKTFGEGTHNEMCFNFISYYPRIDSGFWHWLLPAYSSSCSMSAP